MKKIILVEEREGEKLIASFESQANFAKACQKKLSRDGIDCSVIPVPRPLSVKTIENYEELDVIIKSLTEVRDELKGMID